MPCSVNWPRCAVRGPPASGPSRCGVIEHRVTHISTAALDSPLRFLTCLAPGIAIDPYEAPSDARPCGRLWGPHYFRLGLIAAWSGVCRVPDCAHGLLRPFAVLIRCSIAAAIVPPRSHLPFVHESARDGELSCKCRAGRHGGFFQWACRRISWSRLLGLSRAPAFPHRSGLP